MKIITISRNLAQEVDKLRFAEPVSYVYNPLIYAARAHEQYLKKYARGTREILLLGMNPGPWGMAQTGVPFGEVTAVKEFLGISAQINKPDQEHPKRPVQGLSCTRREVSGARLWGWAKDRFGSADRFFERFLVMNYCPLAFLEETGRNRTPDKLPAAERDPLIQTCDQALRQQVELLKPKYVIGVGHFAETRAKAALPEFDGQIGRILHPSPASPAANRGWTDQAEAQLQVMSIKLPAQRTTARTG